jgi:hypothetical protein
MATSNVSVVDQPLFVDCQLQQPDNSWSGTMSASKMHRCSLPNYECVHIRKRQASMNKRYLYRTFLSLSAALVFVSISGCAHNSNLVSSTTSGNQNEDSAALGVVKSVQDQASRNGQLTPEQFATLQKYANDPDPIIVTRVLTSFAFAGQEQKTAASAIVRSKLSSPSSLIRLTALSILNRLGVSDITSVATGMENDPDKMVQQKAQKILSQHSAGG